MLPRNGRLKYVVVGFPKSSVRCSMQRAHKLSASETCGVVRPGFFIAIRRKTFDVTVSGEQGCRLLGRAVRKKFPSEINVLARGPSEEYQLKEIIMEKRGHCGALPFNADPVKAISEREGFTFIFDCQNHLFHWLIPFSLRKSRYPSARVMSHFPLSPLHTTGTPSMLCREFGWVQHAPSPAENHKPALGPRIIPSLSANGLTVRCL